MATLRDQIATRALQAPTTKLNSGVDPNRVAQRAFQSTHDPAMKRLDANYAMDREKTIAHMRHMMDQERAKTKRAHDYGMASVEQAAKGYGSPIDPSWSPERQQVHANALRQGEEHKSIKSNNNNIATELYRKISTPFDRAGVFSKYVNQFAPMSVVEEWVNNQENPSLYGMGPAGFGTQQAKTDAQAAYLQSMEGQGAANEITRRVGSEETAYMEDVTQSRLLLDQVVRQGGMPQMSYAANPLISSTSGAPETATESDLMNEIDKGKDHKPSSFLPRVGFGAKTAGGVFGGIQAGRGLASAYRTGSTALSTGELLNLKGVKQLLGSTANLTKSTSELKASVQLAEQILIDNDLLPDGLGKLRQGKNPSKWLGKTAKGLSEKQRSAKILQALADAAGKTGADGKPLIKTLSPAANKLLKSQGLKKGVLKTVATGILKHVGPKWAAAGAIGTGPIGIAIGVGLAGWTAWDLWNMAKGDKDE
jgi:hypothetical protein